ncbi:unnamed protein product [Peronospora belbahrii]|uniref:Uncharacterized protein n=1 Tax=Peronospora belbahrii TaxID=622444 RepID=A0AAU9KHD7_9STRA|nr:unnamed protein product [Peronospora belbahrii]CAH0517729.1 unnamed protein product [Peronospora belbahrii]
MEGSTLPNEARTSWARYHLRRALARFRISTYQPRDDEEGQNLAHVRSALAYSLLLSKEPNQLHPMRRDERERHYTYFSSTVKLGIILDREVLDRSLSRFTSRRTQPA